MMTDSISDLFTRIRNASLVRREKITVPFNKTNKSLVQILAYHGFLQSYEETAYAPGAPDGHHQKCTLVLTLKYKEKPGMKRQRPKKKHGAARRMRAKSRIRRVSKHWRAPRAQQRQRPIIVQLKRLSRPGCRLYVKVQNIPKISRYGKLGILFLSTSKGILSDREAYRLQVGGEILGFVS